MYNLKKQNITMDIYVLLYLANADVFPAVVSLRLRWQASIAEGIFF